MTDGSEPRFLFQDLGPRKVQVDLGGGYLSSDGGVAPSCANRNAIAESCESWPTGSSTNR
jgi:hypothetical protein